MAFLMRQKSRLWIAGLILIALTCALAWSVRSKVVSSQAGPSPDAGKSVETREAASATVRPAPPARTPPGPPASIEARKAELLASQEAALQIADPDQRNSALARICYQWAEFDPLGAIEHALSWQLEAVPGLFENLAQQWASTDLPAARAWAETQPPSEFRSELVMRIGFVLAQTDPEAAAHYVVRETEPGPSQTEAAIAVLHQWLKKDPDAAAAWANAFPPGPLRERALLEVEGMRRYQSGDLPVNDR